MIRLLAAVAGSNAVFTAASAYSFALTCFLFFSAAANAEDKLVVAKTLTNTNVADRATCPNSEGTPCGAKECGHIECTTSAMAESERPFDEQW